MMTRISTITVMIVSVATTIIKTGIENFNIDHARLLTPQQNAAFCNPDNPKLMFVNSAESKTCGLPESAKNATHARSPKHSSIIYTLY
jgi:hypothetical protein